MLFKVNDSLIRDLIFERGLTTAELARRAGINSLTARKLVQSGAKVNGRIIATVAKFFGVKGNALLKKEVAA